MPFAVPSNSETPTKTMPVTSRWAGTKINGKAVEVMDGTVVMEEVGMVMEEIGIENGMAKEKEWVRAARAKDIITTAMITDTATTAVSIDAFDSQSA